MLYYAVTTAILAFLLFFPVSRLILVVSVRRLERKTRTRLSERELAGQRTRARFIAIIAVIPFAALFNYSIIGALG